MKILKTEIALTIFFTAVMTSLATIVISPISISLAFWLNDILARPILSVEYVQVLPEITTFSVPKDELNKILFSSAFQMNLLNNYFEIPKSFFEFQNKADLSKEDIAKLTKISEDLKSKNVNRLDLLSNYFTEISEKDLTREDLLEVYRRFKQNDVKFNLDDKSLPFLVDQLRTEITSEIGNQNEIIKLTDDLLVKLNISTDQSIDNIKIRLNILNKGSTDGLVRATGKLSIRDTDIIFSIINIPPPKKKNNIMAIRVTIADDEPDIPNSLSVGKIEMHSLNEFWYEINDIETEKTILDKFNNYIKDKESINMEILLSDHNNNDIVSNFEWEPQIH